MPASEPLQLGQRAGNATSADTSQQVVRRVATNKRRLFFVNRFFYPDHSATSQMLSDLAFALAADGEDVVVIASRQLYEQAAARLAAREIINGVGVHRPRTTRFGRAGLIGRAIDYLSFHLSAGLTLFRLSRRGDVVVTLTDPPLM